MGILPAFAIASMAAFIAILIGSIFKIFMPTYGWDAIIGMSFGVFVGNFFCYLFFNPFS